MIIVTQEQVDSLKKKYGEDFDAFMNTRANSLETMYKAWKLKEWLADCFRDIEHQPSNEIVSKLHCNMRTFGSVFRVMSSDDFDPVTDRATIQTGKCGYIWTADIMVNIEKVSNDKILLETQDGIKKEYSVPTNLL